jgi:hypothetical protein
VRIVAAGSLSQTVCRNDFLIPIGADFRNLNLPALYAYPMIPSTDLNIISLDIAWYQHAPRTHTAPPNLSD